MNIWLVTGDLIDQASGPYAVVNESAETFKKLGNKTLIIGTYDSAIQHNENWSNEIIGHKRKIFKSIHFTLAPFAWLLRLKKTQYPEFVEFHGVWLFNAWIIALFCKLNRIPYSVFLHGNLNSGALKISKIKKKIAIVIAVKAFLKGASFIQVLNKGEEVDAKKFLFDLKCPRKELLVLGNGVRHQSFNKVERSGFVYLGRLHPIKNIESLIEAYSKLDTTEKLFIAGEGDVKYKLKLADMTQKLKLQDKIVFIGFADKSKKSDIFSKAKFFVLPSFSEGQPIAALEALSYGVPVIVSDKCNLTKVQDFINVSSVYPNDIASAMSESLSNYGVDIHKRTYEYCVNKYCWDNIIDFKLQFIKKKVMKC